MVVYMALKLLLQLLTFSPSNAGLACSNRGTLASPPLVPPLSRISFHNKIVGNCIVFEFYFDCSY